MFILIIGRTIYKQKLVKNLENKVNHSMIQNNAIFFLKQGKWLCLIRTLWKKLLLPRKK